MLRSDSITLLSKRFRCGGVLRRPLLLRVRSLCEKNVSLTAIDQRERPKCGHTDVLAKVCASKDANTQVSLHLADDLDGMVDREV